MPKKEFSFEQALEELQSVTERLENGKVALADALSLYERGMELVAFCSKELDDAEQRISAVKITADGIGTEPFVPEVLS